MACDKGSHQLPTPIHAQLVLQGRHRGCGCWQTAGGRHCYLSLTGHSCDPMGCHVIGNTERPCTCTTRTCVAVACCSPFGRTYGISQVSGVRQIWHAVHMLWYRVGVVPTSALVGIPHWTTSVQRPYNGPVLCFLA